MRPADPEPVSPQLVTLTEEVRQLRDLFHRRLLEDKAKNQLYEELRGQLALARGGLAEQVLLPLVRELLLVVDRVTGLNEDDDVVLDSIVEELLELLERRDVRRVPVLGVFDPTVHEAVRTEPRDDLPAGTIVEVLRPGYLLGDRLVRAERVVVAAAAVTDPAGLPVPEGADRP
ncbi:nucleotide exchange factor GrpE [Blastococcus sp. SYSU DS1021]